MRQEGQPLKTVQMTLDEDLVEAVDRAARKLGMSRSAFTRQALRDALVRERIRDLERKHRQGYALAPVRPGEFDAWASEQIWIDP
jgi:metal-responsive CopG/Arc/MetJ family transcriptional regulator